MLQHGAPPEGECTRQVAGLSTETGAHRLIRNGEPHQVTQDTMRESHPDATLNLNVALEQCHNV